MIKRNFEKIKNKKQLKAIEYQGQRQLDMLDEHGRKQLQAINKQKQQLKDMKKQKRISKKD